MLRKATMQDIPRIAEVIYLQEGFMKTMDL